MSTTPLRPTIEMLVGSSWVDITADCRLNSATSGGGIDVVRGAPNEGAAMEPTQFNFTLNNGASKVASTLGRVGCYSPKNPASPYWGQLGRNQRVRLGLGRRFDDFVRTGTPAALGYLPAQPYPDGTTSPGEKWHYYGSASFWSTSSGVARCTGATGNKIATYGKTYGDVDVRAKVAVSTRDSEFGVVLRMANYALPSPNFDGSFDSGGNNGFLSTSGTCTGDTTVTLNGQGSSVKMTTSGTPTSSNAVQPANGMYGPVIPGNSYSARVWARTDRNIQVQLIISYYKQDRTTLVGTDMHTAVSMTANTWTELEHSASATQDAYYARVIVSVLSPPAGTQLWLDDMEMQDPSKVSWYSVYVTPGTTDQLRIGKVSPGVARSVNTNLPFNVVTGQYYWFHAQITGQRIRARFWQDGTPEDTSVWYWRYFDDSTTSEAPGVGLTGEVGLISKDGTATMSVADFYADQWRAHAEISQLPPRWDLSRTDYWVPVQARGILRRLGQGRKAQPSAVTLHLESYTSLSQGWWPLESDTGETAGNNIDGPVGQIRLLTFATPDQTGNAQLPGVSGYASLEDPTSYIQVSVNPHQVIGGKETFLWFMRLPSLPSATATLGTFYTNGTVRNWTINVNNDGSIRVVGTDKGGTIVADQTNSVWNGNTDLPTGCWLACTLYLLQNGSNVNWALNHHRPGSDQFWTINGSYAGSVGAYTGAKFVSNATTVSAGGLGVTQLMQYSGDLPFVTYDFERAAAAYDGEQACLRFMRLAANAGIPVTSTGYPYVSPTMGPQRPDKLLTHLEECAAAEDGFMLEERDDFGLTIVNRDSMWNRLARTLDIDAGHLVAPLEPQEDDQLTRNDVTVNRPAGGFGRTIQTTGPLNVNPPEDDPNGVGVYDEAPDINLGSDAEAQSMSAWRVSKGTLPEPRYPSLVTNLITSAYQNDPALVAQTIATDIGDVFLLDVPDGDYRPREQQVQAYTESIDQFDWDITWTTRPAATRRVGVVNYTTRVDSESNYTSSSFVVGTDRWLSSVDSGPGGPFVTLAASEQSFPFVIETSGILLNVIATGKVLNVNPGFETGDLTGWQVSSANVTATIERYNPKRGTYCVRIDPAGSPTYPITEGLFTPTANGSRFAVSGSTDHYAYGWLKTLDANATDLRLAVDWYDNTNTYISTSLPTPITTVAGTWTWYAATVTSPASAVTGVLRVRNVFAGLYRLYADNVMLIPVASVTGSPQTLTVDTTPVNGFFKTIPSGEQIRIAAPWRMAF